MSLISELRKKSKKDLVEDARSLKQEQMNLRFQKAYGQLESPARIRTVRRQIARIKTLLSQNNREGAKNA
ncbi:MAG: 50S ribosomal protein L29 [Alphaproteobacteria bacterium]|nr:50S ribosomal protein L29 [Alphaproteobacteria bacterium]